MASEIKIPAYAGMDGTGKTHYLCGMKSGN
jgi:hypothetical protein